MSRYSLPYFVFRVTETQQVAMRFLSYRAFSKRYWRYIIIEDHPAFFTSSLSLRYFVSLLIGFLYKKLQVFYLDHKFTFFQNADSDKIQKVQFGTWFLCLLDVLNIYHVKGFSSIAFFVFKKEHLDFQSFYPHDIKMSNRTLSPMVFFFLMTHPVTFSNLNSWVLKKVFLCRL